MKKNLTVWLVVFVAYLLPWSAQADNQMEYRALMMEEPGKMWGSGMKQRTEMKMPYVGQHVSIIRVDKGVVWDLNPKKKTYTEKPIALPYRKQEPQKKDRRSESPGRQPQSREET